MFLLAVARYFKENEQAYASLTEVEKTYGVICEEFGETPSSHTQVWNYAQFLSSLGILKTEVARPQLLVVDQRRVSLLSIPAVELEKELSAQLRKEKEEREARWSLKRFFHLNPE